MRTRGEFSCDEYSMQGLPLTALNGSPHDRKQVLRKGLDKVANRDVAVMRFSTANSSLETKKCDTSETTAAPRAGRQWSPMRARREQWGRCRVRRAEATRRHASHGMQQPPGHVRHERQPKKCLNLENLCESIAIDEHLTVEERRHCGQGKAAHKGAKATQIDLSQNG